MEWGESVNLIHVVILILRLIFFLDARLRGHDGKNTFVLEMIFCGYPKNPSALGKG